MDFSDYSRQRLEEFWRTRLHAAQREHGLALADFLKFGQKWRTQTVPSDGLVMSQALKRESVARGKYIQVLRVFTDLVASGKMPPGSFDSTSDD